MDLSFLQSIHYSHIFRPEFNGLVFSLFGMAMVFVGLLVISLYVAALPQLLGLINGLRNFRKKRALAKEIDSAEALRQRQEEELLAIATALYLHLDFPEEQERITFKSHGDPDSPWKISGRVRGLSMRGQRGRKRDFQRM